MTRNIIISEGEFYHIYNRGTDKRIIFTNDLDKKRFLALLYLCNINEPLRFNNLPKQQGSTLLEFRPHTNPIIAIGAYCLMPNHFHLLAKEITPSGISKFMQKLSTAYTMYFNKARERTGALFQGRFKITHLNTDLYLKYTFSYIHLNPVKLIRTDWKQRELIDKQNIQIFLENYSYSSYSDYCGTIRNFSHILNREWFPDYFKFSKDFIEEMTYWLSFQQG
jgi:putative transposase